MKNIFEKLISKVLPFVLCICIVSGAVAPAYADTTTQSYNYYGITLGDGNTGLTNKNSADMLGYVLSVLSSNQKAIYNKISSSGGSDYSSVLNNIFGTLSNLNNKFNAPIVTGTDKLFFVGDTLSYINKPVWTDGEGIGEQLQAYMSAMSYNLVSVYNKIDNIKTDTSNLSGIKTDTSNLSGIKTDTSNLSGIKTDTSNLSGIKTDTANLNTIKNSLVDVDDYYTSYFQASSVTQFPENRINPSVNQLRLYNTPYVSWRSSTYPSSYVTGANAPISIKSYLAFLNSNLVQVFNSIISSTTIYSGYMSNGDSTVSSYNTYSIMDELYFINKDLSSFISKFTYINLDDATIAAKQANQAQEQSVLTNFTGSGAASASASDFGAVKDSMVDFKAGFSGGASSSDTFSFMVGDSDAWDWFTQETANDLDRTQRNNSRLLRSSYDVAYDTPLLDSYYTSILSILGGDN